MQSTLPNLRRSAFTLVELLVVIVIIALLAGLLLAAFRGAFTASRTTMAQRQLASIAQGVDAFYNDFNYYPPVLTPAGGNLYVRPETSYAPRNVIDELRDARYSSDFSLGIYLLGLGDTNSDGTPDSEEDDGLAGPGFREPGPDRYWGITADGSDGMTPADGRGGYVTTTGRTYGPYLSLSAAESFIERDEATGLYRFTDPWGQPIRYYANWQTTVRVGSNVERTVDYIPVELRSPAAVEGQRLAAGEPAWDRDMDVLNAPYALLSAGESDEVDAQGNPVPRFGDISNPRSPFDPSSLDDNTFRTLMQDLQSNVRYIP
ncbi:MAG: type II secretion system protein [Phycisphaerales bacterium]|nr:type II secretion system protein [Phycisphaerales bacterium]